MLRKFHIKTRLLLSFFIVTFFTFIVGLTGYSNLTLIGKKTNETIHNVAVLDNIYDYNSNIDAGINNMLHVTDSNSTLTGYVIRTTKDNLDKFLLRLNDYIEMQDQFSDVFSPGEMQDMVNILELYEDTYIPILLEICDLVEQGRREEALALSINRRDPISSSIMYYISSGFSRNLMQSEINASIRIANADFSADVMLALVVLSVLVSMILAFIVTKSIAIPLSEVSVAAEKVAHGELDVQFEQSQSDDEITQLSLRLQDTLQYLHQAQQLKLEAMEARHEKEKAEAESQAKSDFLAKMSHEIRTPMNAITGMAELILHREISNDVRNRVQDIKRAGNNLISIINDILDFSKIESGKMEIVPVKYLLSSLVNDTVSIILMRLTEKPIRFFTNIDSNLPNGLIGDEVRMRQILLNLLSNAVKYTERGQISVTITEDRHENEKIWLKVVVTDTGYGIKPEDQTKLFGNFVQVDTKKNQSIEGTGLGLAITKWFCNAMGGEISVESEYGKGSSFSVIIPQGIYSNEPFAAVDEPNKKNVLVFENRSSYSDSVCWSLENMNISHTKVDNIDAFTSALKNEEWFYIFSGYGLYEKIKPVMNSLPDEKKPPLTLMIEWGTEINISDVLLVSLPVHTLSIANILNCKMEKNSYFDGTESYRARFTVPQARLLVVDDIATNLIVVDGLLAPYKATVETCQSGAQAIELVKKNEYDIVFMDHMMPVMDGIETTALIRAWENERLKDEKNSMKAQLPIVALTANTIVGMKEMFIEKGFNDFLAKPIDVSRLDEILDRWIPKEKRECEVNNTEKSVYRKNNSGSALLIIPGVDTARGIAMSGGKEKNYRKVLSMFCKDVEERLPLFKTVLEADGALVQNLSLFVTDVHAIKSAAASVGAEEISNKAAELEGAGRAENMTLIHEKLPVFTEQIEKLTCDIRASLELPQANKQNTFQSSTAYSQLVNELSEAIESKETSSEIFSILDSFDQLPLDAKTKEILETISGQVLMSEFDLALKTIEKLYEAGNQ